MFFVLSEGIFRPILAVFLGVACLMESFKGTCPCPCPCPQRNGAGCQNRRSQGRCHSRPHRLCNPAGLSQHVDKPLVSLQGAKPLPHPIAQARTAWLPRWAIEALAFHPHCPPCPPPALAPAPVPVPASAPTPAPAGIYKDMRRSSEWPPSPVQGLRMEEGISRRRGWDKFSSFVDGHWTNDGVA